MLLVTGATGNVGSAVVAELANKPCKVRVLVRDPARLSIRAPNIEVAVGDFADAASLAAALEGVDAAFLASSFDVRMAELQMRFVDAAKRAGVARVVQLSAVGANACRCCVRTLRWLGQVEQALQTSGMAATHLRAAFFFQNLLSFGESIARQGVIAGPFRNIKWPWVDARDVGAVAAAALMDSAHAGRSYDVTAAEALTYHEVAQRLGSILHVPIRYLDVSANETRGHLQASGSSPILVEAILELWDAFASGFIQINPTDAVRTITGRQPRSLEDFACDYRARLLKAAGSNAA